MAENNKKHCCDPQKHTLMEALRHCDMCSTSYEDHHACLRRAARESGQRARSTTAC
jgi:hypothetical protein